LQLHQALNRLASASVGIASGSTQHVSQKRTKLTAFSPALQTVYLTRESGCLFNTGKRLSI
jgi:hypothetical protein